MQERQDPLDAAIEELARLATPTDLRLAEITKEDGRESFFLSSAGPIIRILRSDHMLDGSRPAYIQFFAINGAVMGNFIKQHESSGMFFSQFSSELKHSRLFRLSARPSFIPPPNHSDFGQIVAESPIKAMTDVGSGRLSRDFG